MRERKREGEREGERGVLLCGFSSLTNKQKQPPHAFAASTKPSRPCETVRANVAPKGTFSLTA